MLTTIADSFQVFYHTIASTRNNRKLAGTLSREGEFDRNETVDEINTQFMRQNLPNHIQREMVDMVSNLKFLE